MKLQILAIDYIIFFVFKKMKFMGGLFIKLGDRYSCRSQLSGFFIACTYKVSAKK